MNILRLISEIHDMVTRIHATVNPGAGAPDTTTPELPGIPPVTVNGAEPHSNVYTEGEFTVSFQAYPENSSVEIDAYRSGNLVARVTLFPLEMDGQKSSLVDKVMAFAMSHLSWVGIASSLAAQFAGPLRDEVNALIHK